MLVPARRGLRRPCDATSFRRSSPVKLRRAGRHRPYRMRIHRTELDPAPPGLVRGPFEHPREGGELLVPTVVEIGWVKPQVKSASCALGALQSECKFGAS